MGWYVGAYDHFSSIVSENVLGAEHNFSSKAVHRGFW